MRYRKLDKNGDYSFGHNLSDFYIDVPDAPAQAVKTRLGLFQGDWWLDRSVGMPWQTKVLGYYTGSTRDAAIRTEVLGTQGVQSIDAYASNLNRDTRAFSAQVTISTIYGQTTVSVANPSLATFDTSFALSTEDGTVLIGPDGTFVQQENPSGIYIGT